MNELWVVYLVTVGWRLYGLRTMWNIARFHGAEYCFEHRVPPDFYEGPGKTLLREYSRRIAWPYVLEAAAALALMAYGKFLWAYFLMVPGVMLMLITRTQAIRRMGREAKLYYLDSAGPLPVTVSLQPRTLGGYTSAWLEWVLGVATVAAIGALAAGYSRTGEPVLSYWFMPLLVLYGHAGCLMIKRAIVEWRFGGPLAPEYEQWRDQSRRLLLATFEWLRVALTVLLAGAGLMTIWPDQWWNANTRKFLLLYPILAVWVAMMVHLNAKRRRFVALSRGMKPVLRSQSPFPDRPTVKPVLGRLCFDKDVPWMWVSTDGGYLFNAANQRARLVLLYLAGWLALVLWMALRSQ